MKFDEAMKKLDEAMNKLDEAMKKLDIPCPQYLNPNHTCPICDSYNSHAPEKRISDVQLAISEGRLTPEEGVKILNLPRTRGVIDLTLATLMQYHEKDCKVKPVKPKDPN